MSYAPTSRSYHDGLEDGARAERARILDLLQEKLWSIDIYGGAVFQNYPDLLTNIALPDYDTEEKTNED